MAINNVAKRSSALDHEEVWTFGTPFPDGTIGTGDRKHAIWTYSGVFVLPSVSTHPLHALATDYLLHAAATAGERNAVLLSYSLVDEAGNRYVDETGSLYITLDLVNKIVLHALATNYLLHVDNSMILLHALATDYLLHADNSPGVRNAVIKSYDLVDEAGNRYVDEAGNYYVTLDTVNVIVLHAPATDYLLHTEAN